MCKQNRFQNRIFTKKPGIQTEIQSKTEILNELQTYLITFLNLTALIYNSKFFLEIFKNSFGNRVDAKTLQTKASIHNFIESNLDKLEDENFVLIKLKIKDLSFGN